MFIDVNATVALWQVRNLIRPLFFLFLAYSGLVYAAGREKNEKKHTEHERVKFLLRLNTRGLPYTHAAQTTRHMGNPNNVSTRIPKALT